MHPPDTVGVNAMTCGGGGSQNRWDPKSALGGGSQKSGGGSQKWRDPKMGSQKSGAAPGQDFGKGGDPKFGIPNFRIPNLGSQILGSQILGFQILGSQILGSQIWDPDFCPVIVQCRLRYQYSLPCTCSKTELVRHG